MIFDKKHVYLVESKDPSVLLAIFPEVVENGNAMRWFDTLRDRNITGKILKNEVNKLEFQRDDGTVYVFQVLTKKTYDEKVKNVVECNPEFPNDVELHRYYTNIANFEV